MATSKLTKLSIAINALVLVAVIILWFQRDPWWESFLGARIERQVSFFDVYAVVSKDVVFLGDSITEGGLWSEIFPEVPVKNRGIGGDTTAGVISRIDQIISGKPRAVFLKIGTNDLTHGPDDRQVSYQQYRLIIERIKTESPLTSIYVQSLLPRASSYQKDVESFNSEIQKIARELDVTYINLYPHFLAEDGSIHDHLSNDELHLMGEGYELWQTLLAPVIEPFSVR